MDSGGSGSQFMGDLGGGEVARLGVVVIVGVEWSLWRGSMVAEMEDASLASMDGAEDRVLCLSASPWVAFFWSV